MVSTSKVSDPGISRLEYDTMHARLDLIEGEIVSQNERSIDLELKANAQQDIIQWLGNVNKFRSDEVRELQHQLNLERSLREQDDLQTCAEITKLTLAVIQVQELSDLKSNLICEMKLEQELVKEK